MTADRHEQPDRRQPAPYNNFNFIRKTAPDTTKAVRKFMPHPGVKRRRTQGQVHEHF
jgi:hypothetical protein